MIKNSILNLIKTITTYAFPLIGYMYASRIFSVDGMGKINFSASYVAYFTLFAMLGYEKYATREVAKVRDDAEKRSKISHEILFMNVLSIIAAYILLMISMLYIHELQPYRALIYINSLSIILTGMGMNWLYIAMEDYKYITVRSIVVSIVSLTALFVFVKRPEDIYIYALIQVASASGANIFNFIHSRKYISYRYIGNYNFLEHLKPILMIFMMISFIEVFTHIDTTMLGFISGDHAVGLYSSAHKVSGVVCLMISSMAMVSSPRISFYAEKNSKEEITKLSSQTINVILFFCIPLTIAVFLLSEEMVVILSGRTFADASATLKILAFRVLFCSINCFATIMTFIPLDLEKNTVISTGIAAITNIILNAIMIPNFAQNGAAAATVAAEIIELIFNLYFLNKIFNIGRFFEKIWQYVLACSSEILIFMLLKPLINNCYMLVTLMAVFSAIIYILILYLLRNQIIETAIAILKKKGKRNNE